MSPLQRWWLGWLCLALLLAGAAVLAWRLMWVQGAPAAAVPASTLPAPVATRLGIPVAGVDDLLAEVARQDWIVRRWRDYPAVLVVQFPGLPVQGQALNRIAALLEKGQGSRDRVLDDEQLQALVASSGDSAASFFLGHDYPAEGLARFFTFAQAQGIALNVEEQRLLTLLLQADLIARAPGGAAGYVSTGVGALVSFSAPQLDDPGTLADEGMDATRRASVLRHELSHGRFFTDETYREHCLRFWHEVLTEPERRAWRRYLDGLGYDRRNEALMANETQALLMHTPDTRDFSAASLGVAQQELQVQQARFRQGLGG